MPLSHRSHRQRHDVKILSEAKDNRQLRLLGGLADLRSSPLISHIYDISRDRGDRVTAIP